MLGNLKRFNFEKKIIDEAILEELRRSLVISNETAEEAQKDKGLWQVKKIFDRKAKMILALFDGEFEENEDRVRTPKKDLQRKNKEQDIYTGVANSALTKRVDKSFDKILKGLSQDSFKATVAEERRLFIKDFISGNKELKEKSKKHEERIE